MSRREASASLTGALLASKGSASPSGSVASLISGAPRQPTGDRETWSKFQADRAADRAAPDPSLAAQDRVKLAFRLDRDRHLKLKLVAAHLRRSSQAVLLAALDAYLLERGADIIGGDCACLAAAETWTGDAD